MSPIGLTVGAEWDYVLNCDKKETPDKQSIFRLKSLTHEQWIVVNNQHAMGDRVSAYLTFGLRGWTNFRDKQGNQITYKSIDGVTNPLCLSHLEHDWKMELAEQIRTYNSLTEDEVKNSESPGT